MTTSGECVISLDFELDRVFATSVTSRAPVKMSWTHGRSSRRCSTCFIGRKSLAHWRRSDACFSKTRKNCWLRYRKHAAWFDSGIGATCIAAKGIFGAQLPTLVFPRNQRAEDDLAICRRHGLTAFCGNEDARMHRARAHDEQSKPMRAGRLLDAYRPISGQAARAA
jgi:hypothetical protein